MAKPIINNFSWLAMAAQNPQLHYSANWKLYKLNQPIEDESLVHIDREKGKMKKTGTT